MTRYDYFETWLTPMEWATWKKYTYLRPSGRKSYLNENIDFVNMTKDQIEKDFTDMIDHKLDWSETPQGHLYWSNVYSRTEPVRTL